MEIRKQKEIDYYDRQAEKRWGRSEFAELRSSHASAKASAFEGFEPLVLRSYQFVYDWLRKNCQGKVVLDYGCGNGIHALEIVKMGVKKIIGIYLSEKSLQIARERVKKESLENKIEFLKMDCEKMDFPDNFFDIIFDGGTFSSLDLKLVYPELLRVLKSGGILIGIETFGHNPVTNLKRKLNKLTGKRTKWAVSHIFQIKNLKEAEKYFNKIGVHYFHIISWLAFPFLRFSAGRLLLKSLEFIDKMLLSLPFLRKYAFKVVFIFSK